MTGTGSGNLADYVRDAAESRPGAPALVAGDVTVSWSALDRAVDAAAAGMLSAELSRGDRVALLLKAGPEYVTAYFAALRAGMVAVPLPLNISPDAVRQLLRHAGVRMVVTDATSVNAVRAADPSAAMCVVVGEAEDGEMSFAELCAPKPPPARDLHANGSELAVIFYKVVAGASPSGVMLTHAALRCSIEQVASTSPPLISKEDVVLLALPLAHSFSLAGILGAVARQGACVVLTSDRRSDEVSRLLQARGVTHLPGTPSSWNEWSTHTQLGQQLGNLRLMLNGSDVLPVDVQRRIHGLTGRYVHEGYGLTEAAPAVSSTVGSTAFKPGSVGRPFPGVEVRFVDEQGNEPDPADGDPAEIWIRGENLFSGYWPDGEGGPDARGWYHTGDIGYLDEDADLHLVNRRKDVIQVSGFRVYPFEVESVLQAHPSVTQSVVFGVPRGSPQQTIRAYVAREPGSIVTSDELVRHCGELLARYKRPHEIVFCEDLTGIRDGDAGDAPAAASQTRNVR